MELQGFFSFSCPYWGFTDAVLHVLFVEKSGILGFDLSHWKELRGGALLFPARLMTALCSVTVTDGKAQLSCQKEERQWLLFNLHSKLPTPSFSVWFPCWAVMTAVCGAAFTCLQRVLLKVDDEQARAFMCEIVDIGGCSFQVCQTLGICQSNRLF